MQLPASETGGQPAATQPRVRTAQGSSPRTSTRSALVMMGDEEERRVMAACLDSLGWTSRFAANQRQARELLAYRPASIAFVDGDNARQCWRNLVGLFRWGGPTPLPCIVVSTRIDSSFWAEVLNLGGYDLVPKPPDAAQLGWVIETAQLSANRPHTPVDIRSKEQSLWIAC